jgi:hypothetical protein
MTATCHSYEQCVTSHAIRRWMERVEGRDLAPMIAAARRMGINADIDGALLDFMTEYAGFDREAVRAAILMPAVRRAMDLRASAVVVGRVRFVIRDGCIASVKLVEMDLRRWRALRPNYRPQRGATEIKARWRPGRCRRTFDAWADMEGASDGQ